MADENKVGDEDDGAPLTPERVKEYGDAADLNEWMKGVELRWPDGSLVPDDVHPSKAWVEHMLDPDKPVEVEVDLGVATGEDFRREQ